VPFPPGELQIFYNYQIPLVDREETGIEFPVDYHIDYMDIMVKSGDVEVATSQLAPAEPVETAAGEKYIHFTGQNIPSHSSIFIQISRLSDDKTSILVVTLIIVAIIALVTAFSIYMVRRKKRLELAGKSNGNNDE
jgi:hypothetical protein